jgi:hypothetical protein
MQQTTKDGLKRVAMVLFLDYVASVGVTETFRTILIEKVYDVIFLVPLLAFSLGYSARYMYVALRKRLPNE